MQEYKIPHFDERGNVAVGLLVTAAATPLCAYAGSYIGEGCGWLWGHVIDVIPYVKDVAPWLAERSGLIHDAKSTANLNVDLYQTTGAIGGFYGGLFLPWRIFGKAIE